MIVFVSFWECLFKPSFLSFLVYTHFGPDLLAQHSKRGRKDVAFSHDMGGVVGVWVASELVLVCGVDGCVQIERREAR